MALQFVLQYSCCSPALATRLREVSRRHPRPANPPNLNGVWSAPFVPDLAKPLGHQPPFTPYAADLFKKEDEVDDPLTQCLPIGPARGIQAGVMPFQIVQTPKVIAILFENQHTFRIINTDGRSHPKDYDPTWFGDSIGTWEGNTLVVDTIGINDRSWLDTAGHQHSDQLHLVELFQKIDDNNLKWTVTFEDPKILHATMVRHAAHQEAE